MPWDAAPLSPPEHEREDQEGVAGTAVAEELAREEEEVSSSFSRSVLVRGFPLGYICGERNKLHAQPLSCMHLATSF